MDTRGRSRRSRFVALVLLGALALAITPRPVVARPRAHCPPPVSGSAITMPMPADCDHAGDPACASMPGCTAPAAAVVPAAFTVAIVFDVARVAAVPPVGISGRLRTGPPTPPPNS